MKKAICLFCGREDSTEKMVVQPSLFKGLEEWIHRCCKAKLKEAH